MAIPTLSSSDFIGSVGLSQDNFGSLTDYINEFYNDGDSPSNYIREFLGEGALQEVIASTAQKWTDIMEGVTYVNSEGVKARFSGVRDMCKNVVFFQYVRDDYIPSSTGLVQNMNENSSMLDSVKVYQKAGLKYNQSIMANNNQLPCFLSTYDNYRVDITGISDIGGGSLSIETNSTLYLYDGDTVAINGTDYVVSNVIEDASFEITSSLITADNYVHSPFSLVEFTKRDSIVL